MTELIKIIENDGKRAVSARELYLKLGYDSSNYAKWFVKNIVNNEFAFENLDWVSLVLNTNVENQLFNPNPTRDFALTIDFAKKLSMLARTKQGEKIRDYFIECENQLLKPKSLSRKELALMVIEAETAKELAEAKVQELAPKAEIYEQIVNAENLLTLNDAAKTIGIGRNKMMQYLRNEKILFETNVPYQCFIDNGYFKVKIHPLKYGHIRDNYTQTFVTGKGLTWLTKRIKNI